MLLMERERPILAKIGFQNGSQNQVRTDQSLEISDLRKLIEEFEIEL